jgi:hypothetical protein
METACASPAERNASLRARQDRHILIIVRSIFRNAVSTEGSMASATLQVDTNGSEPEKKKTLFDIVLTSTPVILTVIATFLVGQSTGEMTRAQYFRAVASQNQSKAGDQWGLFQAKRIRGQSQEMAAHLLMAQNRTLFTPGTFLEVAQGMARELQAAEKAARADNDKAIADDVKKLIPEAEKALVLAKALLGKSNAEAHTVIPAQTQAALDAMLRPKAKEKTADTKASAETADLESAEEAADKSEQAALLRTVIDDIQQKKPESKIAKEILALKDETLDKAIMDAERRANEINKRGKSIDNVLKDFDGLKDRQIELARAYQQIVAPASEGPLARHTEAIRILTGKLLGDYMAARNAFGARRYEDDARSNQDSAYLYEVKVYLASARSDKHLERSKMFLFAMLIAQAGVTISTLALAVRRKSIFWALAALTGLIAIGFGAYVYLDLDLNQVLRS